MKESIQQLVQKHYDDIQSAKQTDDAKYLKTFEQDLVKLFCNTPSQNRKNEFEISEPIKIKFQITINYIEYTI